MTVKELIDELNQYDPNALIGVIVNHCFEFAESVSCEQVEHNPTTNFIFDYNKKSKLFDDSNIINLIVIL